MSRRAPLYANGHKEPDLDQISQRDRDEAKRILKRSIMKWLVGWIIIVALTVWIFQNYFPLRTSLYYSGYILIIFGGALAYASAIGGNYSNTYGAYAGMHDLVTRDILDARGRMFGKWMGPMIGLILGFLMLLYYS